MSAVSWVILGESIALALLLGWCVVREIIHARKMALVGVGIDELTLEIDRLQSRVKGEMS